MLSFKLLPHTADLIIQLEATSPEELFKAAVFGLVSVLKPEDLVINKKDFEYQRELESNSINLLLVDFLSDILTLIHIRKGLVSDIEILNFTESFINYKAYFQIVGNFERDVKAISYHNVKITFNDRDLYEAEIIIDI